MPPKRKKPAKAALRRVGDGIRDLFRSRPVTEPKIESTIENTNWDGLERFLAILHMNVEAFGPLASAIGRFSKYIKMFENQARARKEYKKLGVDLNDIFHALAARFEGASPTSAPLDSFGNLARSIDEETKWLKLQKGDEPNNDGDATKGVDEALRCYRRVRTLLALFVVGLARQYWGVYAVINRLQMSESAKMWKADDDERMHTRLELLSHSPNAHYRAVGSKDLGRTGCTPNTRVDVLQDLREWVHYGKFQKVYWLNGIAGTGKTTIAYSLCEDLENSGKPAASFFCSRDLPECRDVKRIFPSVSYQLARLSRPFRCAVSDALEHDPEVCNQPIDEQFERLIAVPLQSVGHTFGVDVVVVLDGLEECEDKDGVNRILDACFEGSSGLSVRFLITSRRNRGILDRMQASQGILRRAELELHKVDRTVAQEDVRTYLGVGLGGFALSDHDLECLAKRSGASFIYATSVIKYLKHGDFSGMTERLKRLLDIASCTESFNNQRINAMYAATIKEAFDNSGLDKSGKALVMLVLRTAVCARESLTLHAIAALTGLDFSTLTNTTLHLLVPTLQVSTASGLGITLYESFSRYLIDRQRPGRFHLDGERDDVLLAQSCLRLVGGASPAFNICDLDSSYLPDREIAYIDEKVNEAIPQELWYASRHWGTHLVLSEASDDLLTGLHHFLSSRLLLWMEIMNLHGQMPYAAYLLHSVYMWLREVDCPMRIRDLVLDAWMFVEVFSSSAASDSTPHIYVSALGFWPADRPVSTHYMPMLRSVVKGRRVMVARREGNSIVLDGPLARNAHSPRSFDVIADRGGCNSYGWHVGTGPLVGRLFYRCTSIRSVAYSPDGAYIASGSDDQTVRIWDAQTGQPVGQTLNGHTDSILSVAYSPDGAYIASGSDDETVRIWDARTGRPVGQPLNGHIRSVQSVVYSPNGAYIASGSYDRTIQIWDAQTGQPVGQPLNGHTGAVRSVAYSPDGAYVASGSSDKTVRIWEAQTGRPVGQPLNGHTGSIQSVAYSPNSAYIASASGDKTVRIWDAQTGQPVGQPLNGHTGWVRSVAYSPNGAYIASGSDDKTVRIWDAQTGQPVGQPLNGHTDWILSVAYSPDGAYIASGSPHNIVRIWDAQTGQPVGQPLGGHRGSILSVAYSPDGAYIASGSVDSTVRIWDTQTGHLVGQPLSSHTSWIQSVAYSPDGAYIASGSKDKAVRIWDAQTGQPVGQPLKGHTESIVSVAYSPDGAYIASGSDDKTIRIWDAHTSQPVGQPLNGHTGRILSVAYSPDGAYIASGSSHNTVRIWDTQTGQPVGQPLNGHTGSIQSVAYSPDGAHIASGSDDKTVRIWDARTGQPVGQPLNGHTGSIQSVAYSPDGAHIASGSGDKSVRIWDARTGQPVGQPLNGHTDWVMSVAYSPDGAYIASGSDDHTVRIWGSPPGNGAQSPQALSQPNPPATHLPHRSLIPSSLAQYITRISQKRSPAINSSQMLTPATPPHGWVLDDQGWVVNAHQERLIWVPHDLREFIVFSPTLMIIPLRNHLILDFRDTKLGTEWRGCFDLSQFCT
ncbi:hypothetical protein FRC10_005784 [Ceratobasidium sp. 414]|nr:hypothetical protein FRC10_005784 [Ceratobasidium sp. 414]